jgi:Centrosome-associated C terminus
MDEFLPFSGFTIGVIPSVETDDDEPEPESESRTPSGVKMDVEEAMRRLTSLPHPDIRHIASDPGLNVKNPGGPRPAAEATGSTTETPPPSGDGSPVITKNLSQSVVLRNARIYKWLVNCRTAVQK